MLLQRALTSFIAPRFAGTIRQMSIYGDNCPLVLSPQQLNDLRADTGVAILDASWFMPGSPRKPKEEFSNKRIHGAYYLDLDKVASPHELGLKHMMPTSDVFAKACGTFIHLLRSELKIYWHVRGLRDLSLFSRRDVRAIRLSC